MDYMLIPFSVVEYFDGVYVIMYCTIMLFFLYWTLLSLFSKPFQYFCEGGHSKLSRLGEDKVMFTRNRNLQESIYDVKGQKNPLLGKEVTAAFKLFNLSVQEVGKDIQKPQGGQRFTHTKSNSL